MEKKGNISVWDGLGIKVNIIDISLFLIVGSDIFSTVICKELSICILSWRNN